MAKRGRGDFHKALKGITVYGHLTRTPTRYFLNNLLEKVNSKKKDFNSKQKDEVEASDKK